MAAQESATARHMLGLQQAIRDDLDDQVLKHSNNYLAAQQDEEVLLCKVVALSRTGKYQQAQQLIGGIKKQDDFLKFMKGYLAYRLGNYQEAIDIADSSMNDARMGILKSQVFCKRENYEMSCNILATMIVEKSPETKPIYEDLCSNFFNSLALHAWTLVSSKKQVALSSQMKSGLSTSINYCLNSPGEISLREVYLNLCILLAIDTTYGLGIFDQSEFKQYSREFLDRFHKLLEDDTKKAMDQESLEGELSENEKDLLIAKVIEVIFERKKNRIRVLEGDVAKLERDYAKLGDDDIFLKTSVLSYLIYMKMNTGENVGELHLITKDIESILSNLKKSNLTKKLQEIIHTNLLFNKSITLLVRGKFQDVKDLELSNDIWDNLSIKAYVFTKNKKVESVEELSKEVNTGKLKDKFLINLLQIGSFHLLNNQNLYLDKFVDFMTVPFFYVENGTSRIQG